MAVGENSFWAKYIPKRGDVGPELEMSGLIADKRYFRGYADIQRLGVQHDFCRMVQEGKSEKNKYFACALAGTENMSSTSFRTPSVQQGFQLSRDDYMRDTTGAGREDYCRILKNGDGTFEPKCNIAGDTEFSEELSLDVSPPPPIQRLLRFYQGCVFWLRFRDDMIDYAGNLYLNSAGGAQVDESEPNPQVTKGLELNGTDQYLRIGDDKQLGFGSTVMLRSLRAFSFWVYFDEFTNNARIFDFGNGAGIDNVWLGILGRGNSTSDEEALKRRKAFLCGSQDVSTVPEAPSGAQVACELSPQNLMKTTDANVEEYTCEGFAVAPRQFSKTLPKASAPGLAETADLVYEIWLRDNRKMRIVVPTFFRKGEWTHVTVTAETNDAFRPNILIYRNGELTFTQPDGWLPQNNQTKYNYIGKSNWANQTSQYSNRDELLKGSLFDFRGYDTILNDNVIRESYTWGKELLGIN